ncbi:MAG: hypothetical protein BGO70_05950 [Bacteroidetes bacterium 43-93]|nr:MAG: hypothetical protein BGO70_05950 [Bacteroidetes bacterium 43-93]
MQICTKQPRMIIQNSKVKNSKIHHQASTIKYPATKKSRIDIRPFRFTKKVSIIWLQDNKNC